MCSDFTRRGLLRAGRRLARLESVMRDAILSHAPFAACVSACVDFFREAVVLGHSGAFDELADVLDEEGIEHGLGSRALDLVFESGPISDGVVLRLVRLFDDAAEFREAMISEGWATSVEMWRGTLPIFAVPTDGLGDLTTTAPLPIPSFLSSPQGDLFASCL